MKKQYKLGIIGCGATAQTIIKGAVLSDFLHEKKILVSDVSEERLDEILELGVHATQEDRYVAENCEYLIFAVNSESFKTVVKKLEEVKAEKVISVTSGVTKNFIKTALGANGLKVARCVLSVPCSVGSGVVGVDMSDFDGFTSDTEFISNLFNCVGTVLSVDESKLNSVSAISDGGTALAFAFMDGLADAGVKQGMSRDEAKLLAVQSLIGAIDMAESDSQTLAELTVKSCKGNTAIEAVKVFEQKNFRGAISEGLEASANRLKSVTDK